MRHAVLAVLLAASQGLPAQPRESPPAAGPGNDAVQVVRAKYRAAGREDRAFMQQAVLAGHAQVAAGKLAVAQARHPAVRDFGRRVLRDHRAIHRRLQLLALDTQVALPSRPTRPDRRQLERLKALEGERFDDFFLAHFGVFAHRQAISLFREVAASKTARPALRRLARQTLPMLEQHLRLALELQDRDLKGPNAS